MYAITVEVNRNGEAYFVNLPKELLSRIAGGEIDPADIALSLSDTVYGLSPFHPGGFEKPGFEKEALFSDSAAQVADRDADAAAMNQRLQR